MRTEGDQNVALIGHMARKRRESSLAREGRAADATHREHLAPIVLHQHSKAVRFVVDLVRAEGCSQKGALIKAIPFEDSSHPSMHGLTGERPRKVFVEGLVHWGGGRGAPSQPSEYLALGTHCSPRRPPQVLLDGEVRESVHEIDGTLPLLTHFKHQGQEMVHKLRVRQVDLNATDQDEPPAAEVCVHDPQHPVLHELEGLVCAGGHRVLGRGDPLGVRCKLLLDLTHLHVCLVHLWRCYSIAAHACVVCPNHRAACSRVTALTFAQIFAHFARL
mmetsp:Transcript_19852/g.43387  ORF Transcript_19852/g.43387 Transcript_19852/m.43387 type:complete len:275 (+) Transcript_19852:601-1425(+)